MKSKNKTLRPPPRKPWMLDNTSSSSLRNMEIGVPPAHNKHLPPTPAAVSAYKTKPLPPLPLRRSRISRFSAEIQNAFRTPTNVNYHIPEVKRQHREASIAVVLDTDSDRPGKGPEFGTGYTFTETPVQDVHSPTLPKTTAANSTAPLAPSKTGLAPPTQHIQQHKPTGSVQKLLEITGADSVASLALTNTSLAPSGHNPAHKIKQIMGFEAPLDQSRGSRGPADEVSPLTPHSRSSSIYSQDVSDRDSKARHEREQLSTPGTSVTLSSHLEPPGSGRPASIALSAVPDPLHFVKAKDRTAELASLSEQGSPSTNNYSHANGAFRQDLYHATVSEIAHSTPSSSEYSQSVKSRNSVRDGGADLSLTGINTLQLPQRHSSFTNRAHQSRTRFSPPHLTTLDTLNSTKYNAPVKTPYPLPMSKFEYDDDDDDDDATPTQRVYDGVVPPVTIDKQSPIMNRITRRVSSPISPPKTQFAWFTPAELSPILSPRSYASAFPSPLRLRPPPLLKHRKVKSHDTLRSDSHTVSDITTDEGGKSSRRNTSNLAVRTSRRITPRRQASHSPTSRPLTPFPPTFSGSNSRSATPIPKSRSRSRSVTPTPTPFVPPLMHQPSHRSRRPPPIPPRGPTPPPQSSFAASKPSLTESAALTLNSWMGRASGRLEQVRLAAGIRTGAERRRCRLKENIKVIGPGKLEAGRGPLVVPTGAKENGKKGSREKVRIGMMFEKYSEEKGRQRGKGTAKNTAGVKVWI